MAAPGGPRPGNIPHNYNPNSLSDNMQNLQLNRPIHPPSSVGSSGGARPPPPLGQQPSPSSAPYSSPFTGASPVSRPGPPPPGVFPRSSAPPGVPPQATLPPNAISSRPIGSVTQPTPPFASRPLPSFTGGPSPDPFASPPLSTHGPFSNGPPARGAVQGGLQFSSPGSTPRPQVGPPPLPPGPPMSSASGRTPVQAPTMRSLLGSTPQLSAQPAPPFSAPLQAATLPSGSSPFSGSSYGPQMWPIQPQQVVPPLPIPGSAQPPRIFGMTPPLPDQSTASIPPALSHTGSAVTGSSKIDPNQIPRPIPSSSVVLHETRQGNQANPPLPATSEYIVKDTGNCSPRYMRCTINQISCTYELLATSGMQLALLTQPLALPRPSEEPIQVLCGSLFHLIILIAYLVPLDEGLQ